jgi:UDPglucose--hexose-1-phosphate uridylyltransferase
VREIIKKEIGTTFVRVLTDAGVYKRDAAGRAAFLRFIEAVNASK